MIWQMWDLKKLFAYPGCDAGIRSMALSYDQRLEQSLIFARISEIAFLLSNYVFFCFSFFVYLRS